MGHRLNYVWVNFYVICLHSGLISTHSDWRMPSADFVAISQKQLLFFAIYEELSPMIMILNNDKACWISTTNADLDGRQEVTSALVLGVCYAKSMLSFARTFFAFAAKEN
jgi:hypothetical protein